MMDPAEEKDIKFIDCPDCNGTGVIKETEGDFHECERCYGGGEVPYITPNYWELPE